MKPGESWQHIGVCLRSVCDQVGFGLASLKISLVSCDWWDKCGLLLGSKWPANAGTRLCDFCLFGKTWDWFVPLQHSSINSYMQHLWVFMFPVVIPLILREVMCGSPSPWRPAWAPPHLTIQHATATSCRYMAIICYNLPIHGHWPFIDNQLPLFAIIVATTDN